ASTSRWRPTTRRPRIVPKSGCSAGCTAERTGVGRGRKQQTRRTCLESGRGNPQGHGRFSRKAKAHGRRRLSAMIKAIRKLGIGRKRKMPRQKVRGKVILGTGVSTSTTNRLGSGNARDLSASGISFETNEELLVGSTSSEAIALEVQARM